MRGCGGVNEDSGGQRWSRSERRTAKWWHASANQWLASASLEGSDDGGLSRAVRWGAERALGGVR